MMVFSWLIHTTVCLFTLFITACRAQCPNPGEFETIPEDEYSKNITSVTPGGRPLGFDFRILYYEADGRPSPCFVIPNTDGGRRVEIMAEPDGVGSSQICVRDTAGNDVCDTRIYLCRQANGNSLNVEFYCDAASCDESDVRMWIRFTVSPPASALDPELWCDGRDTGEYPSSLARPLPPGVTLAPPPMPTTASVARIVASLYSILIIATSATVVTLNI